MNIGIITVHDSANFGSYLQAYALKRVLENLGHKVYFIKARSENVVRKVFLGTIRHPKGFLRDYFFNIKKYKEFLKDRKLFQEIEIDEIEKENIDTLLIGSDELWNVRTKAFTNEKFYGIKIPIKRKIAFAISCGKAEPEDYEKYPNLLEGMKDLEDIFVRDKKTQQNMKQLLNKDCEMVCDPTFLLDVNEFDKDYEVPIKEKYLLVYSYYFTDQEQEYIKKFARENNLIIVSACFKHKFCDKCIICSPLQFCKIIQQAQYVVTTTFHGTIFSILNKKSFISIPASQKVDDVLEKFKMEECKFDVNKEKYEDFKAKILTEKDFKNSQKELLNWREKSLEVLRNIIKG